MSDPFSNVSTVPPCAVEPTICREEYVQEPLAMGFFCRACGVFNGDAKVFLVTCRSCDAPRPRLEHVVRGTKGKR